MSRRPPLPRFDPTPAACARIPPLARDAMLLSMRVADAGKHEAATLLIEAAQVLAPDDPTVAGVADLIDARATAGEIS